jgi:hypothetical protein
VHRDRKVSNPTLISQLINVAPTEGNEVLQNYKSVNGNTASTSEKNGSNSGIHVQDRKGVHEKKQPNWMISFEFVCLLTNSQGGYCMNPISCTEALQSNEQKQ